MEVTCGIFLFSTEINRILVGHVTNHDIWSIPKGRYDKTDIDFFNTAIRELWEETNISLNDINVIYTYEFDYTFYRSNKKKLKSFLIVTDTPVENLNLKCNSNFKENGVEYPEFDRYKWIKVSSLSKYVHHTQYQNEEKIKNLILKNL